MSQWTYADDIPGVPAPQHGTVMPCGCVRPDDAGETMGWHLTANHFDDVLAHVQLLLGQAARELEKYISARSGAATP